MSKDKVRREKRKPKKAQTPKPATPTKPPVSPIVTSSDK
jgi:hypothetical protein